MPELGWTDLVIMLGGLLFIYPFALYPPLMKLLSRQSKYRLEWPVPEDLPRVALVICALNEQKIIGQKLENCLDLDYPRDRLRTVVVSDGSTDATAEIVRNYAARGIELIERKQRRGKVANLNEVVPAQPEDIVILSDANVIYDTRALRFLVAPFSDPAIGCVSGRVFLVETTADLRSGESSYYSVEWQLQEAASRVYAMPGADGAMFAIRKSLFAHVPNDTLIEDFVFTLGVVRQGRRVVFQPKAVGWERGPERLTDEFRRKVRIAAGAAQGLLRGNAWPVNAPASFWFIWTSHKLLRWLSPVFGAAVLAAALVSPARPFSMAVLAAAAVLTILAVARLITGSQATVFNWPFYFVFGQIALLVGLSKGVLGKQSVLWVKADR